MVDLLKLVIHKCSVGEFLKSYWYSKILFQLYFGVDASSSNLCHRASMYRRRKLFRHVLCIADYQFYSTPCVAVASCDPGKLRIGASSLLTNTAIDLYVNNQVLLRLI